MLNILINAYAVAPNWGSEQGLAWNWITCLAKYCNLFIITEGEWQKEIEEAVEVHPLKDRMHFYFNPVSPEVRKMCWNQGDWRFYIHYRKWQKKTLEIAREICKKEKIDITHQLNMIGFREPGLLWQIEGVKHVWGPIGSMGAIPNRFLKDLPLKVRAKSWLKNVITEYQITHGTVKEAIEKNDALVAALSVTHDKILQHYDKDVLTMGETGLTPNEGHPHGACDDRPIELLWVGRFIPTKKLSIALEALAKTDNPKDFRLHIVGPGTPEEDAMYKKMAVDLGINDIVTFHGRQPNEVVQKMMREKDLFYFTSVHEGGPHVILEAITNNLPILCFDTCGQGVVTDSSIGLKVPFTTLEEGIKGFTEKLNYINAHRELLPQLSANCTAKQRELSWESKVQKMLEIYDEVMKVK